MKPRMHVPRLPSKAGPSISLTSKRNRNSRDQTAHYKREQGEMMKHGAESKDTRHELGRSGEHPVMLEWAATGGPIS